MSSIPTEYAGTTLTTVSLSAMILTTLSLILRFLAKHLQHQTTHLATPLRHLFGADDLLLLAAYPFTMALCVLGIVMVTHGGVGTHTAELEAQSPDKLVEWYKLVWVFELVYFVAVTLPKMAILCLYLRVFNWKGAMRVVTLGLLVSVVATGASLFMAACLQCRPLAFWWDKRIKGGRCFGVQAFFDAQCVLGFVLDVVIMVMPLRTIWGLHLPIEKRVALLFIFFVASCGVIASIVRTGSFFLHPALEDPTINATPLSRWSIVESSCYVMANCFAHLRPLISRITPVRVKRFFYKAAETAIRAGSSQGRRGSTPGPHKDGIELRVHIPKPVLPQPARVSTMLSTAGSDTMSFRGQDILDPPYTHEIAGGGRWHGRHPSSIQVVTEVSLHSGSSMPADEIERQVAS